MGEPISLKKTEERLCRQLGRKGLDRDIQRRLIKQASPRIDDDTLLVLDLLDVTKKYAQKMEHLARVRDGSAKELAWGYWTLSIIGSNTKGTKIVPLYGRLFSHAVEGHESENIEIQKAMDEVADEVGRCLTYHRLQALIVLVTAAAYFAAVYLGPRTKMRVLAGHVLRASKRLLGIPDFRLYALADGIRQYLHSQTQGLKSFMKPPSPGPIQPKLFDST